METNVSITLNTLHCNREGQGSDGSAPYIWPAMLWVNRDTATVGVIGTLDDNSHTVLKRGMKPGDTVNIPSNIGEMGRPFDDPLTNHVIIITVGLLQDNETPDHSVKTGYLAFQSTLQQAVQENLLDLNSNDPARVDAAVEHIKTAVTTKVTDAIHNSLSLVEKGKVATGILTLDSTIDSSFSSFSNLTNSSFTLSFGGSFGGRLLFYRDASQSGGGEVSSPKVIGLGGWASFKFLFSGSDGVLYAVNDQGQLLFYRDSTQDGTGDVNTPQVIGQGGWQEFPFLFSGGKGVIYAVNPQGQLLRYQDASQSGGGDVSSPQVIGQGGWQEFRFLFSGGDGVIYAVNPQGQLLRYQDASQSGGGDVSSPQVIGQGGWQEFLFLFSGGNGIIYAAEKALNPKDNYEIAGNLDVSAVVCADERDAVAAATTAEQAAKSELAALQQQFQDAPVSERPLLRAEIKEAEQQLAAAEEQLAAAKQSLAACVVRSGHRPVRRPVVVDR